MTPTRRNRHAAVAATALTATASWMLATHAAGVHLGVALGATIGASATATLAGWVVLSVLEHRVDRPRRTWIGLAVGVFVVSLALPPAFAVTTAAAAAVAAIHLAVATAAITGLARTAPARRLPMGSGTPAHPGMTRAVA